MRICETCGKPITWGCMTDGYGDWQTHEGKCFNKYMNKTFGKHRWMKLGNGEEDGEGGYYIATADVAGGYEGTGIFYTEYEEEE